MYFTILLLIGLTAYGSGAPQIDAAAKSVSKANNEFGFNVYKKLASKPGNIVFSPISAETVLALTFTGADGSTATEMQSTLRLPDKKQTIAGFSALTRNVASNDANFQFTTANKIYPDQNVQVKQDFIQTAKKDFNAEIENLDFTQAESSANTINKWVEAKTNNKIHDLVDADSIQNAFMVLVNAVYFFGKWLKPFHSNEYTKMQFYVHEKKTVEVPSMHVEDDFQYKFVKELNADVLEIPYNNTDFAMLIILPKDVNGLKQVEAKLPIDLETVVNSLESKHVSVTMPKFKIEYESDLEDILQSLGMTVAFTPAANFKGMTDNSVKISKVKQKAFIEVNEKGTEAAAATVVGIVPASAIIYSEQIYFIADKPFAFILYQQSTKMALFVGSVSQP